MFSYMLLQMEEIRTPKVDLDSSKILRTILQTQPVKSQQSLEGIMQWTVTRGGKGSNLLMMPWYMASVIMQMLP